MTQKSVTAYFFYSALTVTTVTLNAFGLHCTIVEREVKMCEPVSKSRLEMRNRCVPGQSC